MLRILLFTLIGIFTGLLGGSSARAMVFLSVDAGSESFASFLDKTHQQSYTQWYLNKSRDEIVTAHEEVLDFSRSALATSSALSKNFLAEWERLRTKTALNREDAEVLALLAAKKNVSIELCRSLYLQPELAAKMEEPLPRCGGFAAETPKAIFSRLADQDLVVIDGVLFSKGQIPSKLVTGKYRWQVISNRYQTEAFVGTAEEFSKKKFPRTPWAEGGCENYKLATEDFSLLAQAKVYFGEQCVKPGLAPVPTLSNWASEHKKLLWGVGILAAGFAAYSLKDKNLEITRP